MILDMARELAQREVDADDWIAQARAHESASCAAFMLGFFALNGATETVLRPELWPPVMNLVWLGLIG